MELPLEFRDYAAAALGEEIAGELCSNIESQEELTSVRVNPFKGGSLEKAFQGASGGSGELSSGSSGDGSQEVSGGAGIETEPVMWSSLGHYLSSRPVFTLDPLFHAGGYYVQEASSMYMEMVRDAIEADYRSRENAAEDGFFAQKLAALDLCAAPGGKSTHLASLLGDDSLLVSNEVIKSRAVILADNIAKWGRENVVVTNSDPADFGAFEELFDLLVVDAPCSGEGLFRKDPQAAGEWSPANVNLCAQRQQRILADIWPSLAPGGYLVYSTCTYNKFENDGNLRFLCEELGAEAVKLVAPEGSGIIETPGGGFQFVPGRVKGEGQYMALVRKNGGWEPGAFASAVGHSKGGKKHKGGKDAKGKNQVQFEKGCNYLPDNYIKILQGDLVKGYREDLYERIRFVEENLKTVLSGIATAEKKGKDYIPHADFALTGAVVSMVASSSLPSGISAVEVGREDALKFLAKEPLLFPGAPMGYLLLVYGGLPLGFVKNLGNRSNNLLPMARRIRMNIGL